MRKLEEFVNEKLKVSKHSSQYDNDTCTVIFGDFLMWFYDVKHDYELSIDLINDQSDVLYQIEQYYGCGLSEAYHFIINRQSEEVEIETKGKPGNYEFLIVLKKGKEFRNSRNGDILLRFYKDEPIPEDIKL